MKHQWEQVDGGRRCVKCALTIVHGAVPLVFQVDCPWGSGGGSGREPVNGLRKGKDYLGALGVTLESLGL